MKALIFLTTLFVCGPLSFAGINEPIVDYNGDFDLAQFCFSVDMRQGFEPGYQHEFDGGFTFMPITIISKGSSGCLRLSKLSLRNYNPSKEDFKSAEGKFVNPFKEYFQREIAPTIQAEDLRNFVSFQ